MKESVIVNCAPAAWLALIEKDPEDGWKVAEGTTFGGAAPTRTRGTAPTPTTKKRFLFDNLGDTVSVTVNRPADATTAQEFGNVTRGDGAIMEFPKRRLTIDLATGSAKSGQNARGANGGTIAFTTNTADLDSVLYNNFFKKLNQYASDTFLACVPLGYDLDFVPQGYAYLIGTLQSDPQHSVGAYAPGKVAFTIKSIELTGAAITELLTAVQLPGILVPEGYDPATGADTEVGADDTPTGITLTPPALTATDWENMARGIMVIK